MLGIITYVSRDFWKLKSWRVHCSIAFTRSAPRVPEEAQERPAVRRPDDLTAVEVHVVWPHRRGWIDTLSITSRDDLKLL